MDSTTSQTRQLGWGTSQKMVKDDLLFHFFTPFSPLPHGQNITKLKNIYISTWRYSLSEGNSSPIWRNNIAYVLLDTMVYSQLWFTIITNLIYSGQIPHMVFPFILVPLHWQAQCQTMERIRGKTTTNKFQAQWKA